MHTIEQTKEAYDVPSTIEKVITFQPDILFLDLHMPGGTGFDVLEKIQASEENHKPVTIVFTNFADKQNRKKSIALGAHYCFDKTKEMEQAISVLHDFQ